MSTKPPRLRILSVGGNSVSAFLSWRLQATNACDVTLVWKNGFESVYQYGISFKSARFGNERFKPRSVVRTPEEASSIQKGAFDYVLLCIKALPDVYDIASVIESVVTPQHTCILINTSHSLGVESMIEKRFPKNVVLSLVSAVDIVQLGSAEFEHQDGTDLWVGPANLNSEIPVSIQGDMAEALAMTLCSGQVDCKVSKNIQQQQFERMVGPIAFHTTSVLFETPSHADLLELTGVRTLVSETVDEILRIAEVRGCSFAAGFKDKLMEDMVVPKETSSIMYQDYAAKRPMEIETYLGAPMKLAEESGVNVPRIQTLYAMLHHINIVNQKRSGPPMMDPQNGNGAPSPLPRPSPSVSRPPMMPAPNGHMGPPGRPPMGGPMMGGPMRNSRAPSMTGPPGRRVPSMMNGYGGPPPTMNGMGPPPSRGPGQLPRKPSYENGLDQFSHLINYDNDGIGANGYGDANGGSGDIALRERELMLRQKELALREREMSMRQGGRPRPPPSNAGGFDDDDDEGDDYFDPSIYRGPPVDPDNVDMMSITSRRNRKAMGNGQLRGNPGPRQGGGNPFGRGGPKNRTSSRLTQDYGSLRESLMENPLMGYSSDRYGDVDRRAIGRESRTSSLTAARLNELSQGQEYGAFPPVSRRASQSPGNPLSPGGRMPGPPPPQNGYYPGNGMSPNGGGRPSPPGMRQPVPKHPPGHGNAVAPHDVEQRAGVSNLYPPKSSHQVRSLTGSASASAGSGDSGRSGPIDSENSAYSSQSSFGPRQPIGVR